MDGRVKPGPDAGESLPTQMTIHLETQSDLEEAVHALIKRDPRLKPVLEIAGMPALRRREPGFTGLAHIVCGQQLSTASAAAIWGRLSAAFDPFDHEAVSRARTDRLGRLGLSAAKIKTLKHLAREINAQRLNLDVLAEEDAEAAHHTLIALPGIGPWTANYIAMRALRWPDAFPKEDIVVRNNLGGITAREAEVRSQAWRPWRSYAVMHIWGIQPPTA